MRTTILLAFSILFFSACKKDKYTTAPQISFKSISPNAFSSNNTILESEFAPKLTISVTDAEGDLGFKLNQDTAKVFIKNLLTNNLDSFNFPDLHRSAGKNFKADVTINLFNALECRNSGPPRPRTDTLYFDVYVTDFAKNKSNVITTSDPVYYRCL